MNARVTIEILTIALNYINCDLVKIERKMIYAYNFNRKNKAQYKW